MRKLDAELELWNSQPNDYLVYHAINISLSDNLREFNEIKTSLTELNDYAYNQTLHCDQKDSYSVARAANARNEYVSFKTSHAHVLNSLAFRISLLRRIISHYEQLLPDIESKLSLDYATMLGTQEKALDLDNYTTNLLKSGETKNEIHRICKSYAAALPTNERLGLDSGSS